MPDSAALLITRDPSLVKLVHKVAHSITNLRLLTVEAVGEACSRLQQHDVALLLPHLTQKSNPGEVARLVETATAARQPVATIVLSDQNQGEQAVALLRHGAAGYLERPFDLDRLACLMDVLTVRARYEVSEPRLVPRPYNPTTLAELDPLMYISASTRVMMEQIDRVAPQETTLLLLGETGTGKTRLAHLIHQISPRRGEPFLVVHCAALSATLIESEMFGHVKGAFTGADRDRIGKFTEVGRGTILLDDIDALPIDLQAKLLRVAEERVYEPVGSNRSFRMQARLITASNRALDQEVAAGRFRADLYYRLNVVGFYLVPLREQREVIPVLATQFLFEFAARSNREFRRIAPAALRVLSEYDWPGNIRELRNVMERAVALSQGSEIQLEDLSGALESPSIQSSILPPEGLTGVSLAPVASTLAHAKDTTEVAQILKALRKHKNNRLRAAAELGISRMTLYNKLRRYGLVVHKVNESLLNEE